MNLPFYQKTSNGSWLIYQNGWVSIDLVFEDYEALHDSLEHEPFFVQACLNPASGTAYSGTTCQLSEQGFIRSSDLTTEIVKESGHQLTNEQMGALLGGAILILVMAWIFREITRFIKTS